MRKPSPGRKTGSKPLLVAVWGLETGDYGYFDVFYPACRVREACERAGVSSRFVFPRDLPPLLDGGKLNPETTAFLIRGSAGPDAAASIEAAGFRAVNASRPLALALDKLETARFLERHGWQTPRTVACGPGISGPGISGPNASGVNANRANETRPIPFPAVLKPRFGSRGRGVTLVEDDGALNMALGAALSAALGAAFSRASSPEGLVLQEYVRSSRGRDVRFFFAGGRVLAVAERIAPQGELVSNASRGGVLRVPPWTTGARGKAELERWSALTLEIARESGLQYGSVDYLYAGVETGEESRDGSAPGTDAPEAGLSLTVCEINGSPGFEALERELGIDVAGPLVASIVSSLGWRDPARPDGN